MMLNSNKGAINLTFEVLVKILLVIVFILIAIYLMFVLQQGSLENIEVIDPKDFIENIFKK